MLTDFSKVFYSVDHNLLIRKLWLRQVVKQFYTSFYLAPRTKLATLAITIHCRTFSQVYPKLYFRIIYIFSIYIYIYLDMCFETNKMNFVRYANGNTYTF